MPWGTILIDIPILSLTEPGNDIETFQYKNRTSQFAQVNVDSLKLLAINGQFGKVVIRYQSEETHQNIMRYLQTKFGKIKLRRGAMIRGLNQGYTWRGADTEVILHYRGLGERGFLTIQSRILAPRFLEIASGSTH